MPARSELHIPHLFVHLLYFIWYNEEINSSPLRVRQSSIRLVNPASKVINQDTTSLMPPPPRKRSLITVELRPGRKPKTMHPEGELLQVQPGDSPATVSRTNSRGICMGERV